MAVTIWRRAARMAHLCLAPLSDPEHTENNFQDAEEEQELTTQGLYPTTEWHLDSAGAEA